jgi:hypothetical protein
LLAGLIRSRIHPSSHDCTRWAPIGLLLCAVLVVRARPHTIMRAPTRAASGYSVRTAGRGSRARGSAAAFRNAVGRPCSRSTRARGSCPSRTGGAPKLLLSAPTRANVQKPSRSIHTLAPSCLSVINSRHRAGKGISSGATQISIRERLFASRGGRGKVRFCPSSVAPGGDSSDPTHFHVGMNYEV